MIKAIIVDDEKASRDALKGLLQRYCSNVEVVAEGENVAGGIEVIRLFTPDLVFLDVQMPDGSGFRLLEQLDEISFEVIFTTAFDQYAIKAIKYSALDYLLKPIIPDDLIKAIEKFKQRKTIGRVEESVRTLLENLQSKTQEPKKIVLNTAEGMHIVLVDDIVRCMSDDCYTHFFFKDGKKMLISKTLKDNEELLSSKDFIRPHKSHLINLKYVKSFVRNDGGYIVMIDDSQIPVSRRKREEILDILSHQ